MRSCHNENQALCLPTGKRKRPLPLLCILSIYYAYRSSDLITFLPPQMINIFNLTNVMKMDEGEED